MAIWLVLLTATGAVAQGIRAEDVMLETVPGPYELSPEEAGVTGPFDADKAKQLGLPTEPFKSGQDVIADSYLRIWTDPPQTSFVMALIFKATEEAAAAGMLNGAIEANQEAGREEFDVAIPDGRGFTEVLRDQSVVHSVFFRRGLYQAAVVTGGTREARPDLVISLADEQFELLPEGATAPRGPLSPAELGYKAGTMFAVTIQAIAVLGAVVALIVWLVRRRRNATTPQPAGSGPAYREGEPTRLEYQAEAWPTHPPPASDEEQRPLS